MPGVKLPEVEKTGIITDITLELTGDERLYMVSAKQGDKRTRFIRIALTNNGKIFKIPTGYTVIANIKKPDNHFCYNECAVTDNKVMVELTNQALAAAGTAHCDIEIRAINNAYLLTSQSFTIEIEETNRNEDAIKSSNEMTALEKTVQQHIDNIVKTKEDILSTEATMKTAETARASAEAGRVKAEYERTGAEVNRINAEAARVSAESDREKAEKRRNESEKDRQLTEMAREQLFRNMQETAETERKQQIQNIKEAMGAANDAASSANMAAKKANDATSSAEEAAKKASDVATAMKIQVAEIEKTEHERGENEIIRGNAEADRGVAEIARAGAEERRNKSEQDREDAEKERKKQMQLMMEARKNADNAAYLANSNAGEAQMQAEAANRAAAACKDIAKGINSISDAATGKRYTIGVEAGKVFLEEIT